VYQLFVRTDSANEIGEPDEDNNRLGAAQTLVASLYPRCDLQVTAMLAPTRVTSGGVVDADNDAVPLGWRSEGIPQKALEHPRLPE
jgi:hypothetical protein